MFFFRMTPRLCFDYYILSTKITIMAGFGFFFELATGSWWLVGRLSTWPTHTVQMDHVLFASMLPAVTGSNGLTRDNILEASK
jgi:hypothetical protein